MRHDPHLLVEGCLIAGFAMGAHAGYIYVRGEFIRERERLQAAIDQAYEAKLIGKNNVHGWDFDLYVHHGAGAYICGEETALLGKPRRQEGPAAAEAAVPGQRRPLRLPDHRQQRRDRSRWCPTSCAAARPGSPASAGRTTPAPSCSASPATSSKPVHRRRGDGHPAARADRDACRRRARRLGQSAGGHSRRLVDAAGAGGAIRPTTLLMDFDGCARAEIGARHRRRHRHGQVDRHRPGDGAHLLFLQARELRPVHAVPRGHGLDVARARRAWRTAARRSARSTCCCEVTKQIEGHTICAFGDGAAWPVQGLLRHFRPEIERRIDEYTRNADARTARCARRRSREGEAMEPEHDVRNRNLRCNHCRFWWPMPRPRARAEPPASILGRCRRRAPLPEPSICRISAPATRPG